MADPRDTITSIVNYNFVYKIYYFTIHLCKQILNLESRGLVFLHNQNPNLFLPMGSACN